VEVILDKVESGRKEAKTKELSQGGVPIFIDARHSHAHNKLILIDHKVIITGSFNFTGNAEDNNAENLLIIRDQPELVREYEANYARHKEHAEKY
jgi:phosphatidylserine/phosphatidylglycerophosphate/cardiolipin synthase-like enzyme